MGNQSDRSDASAPGSAERSRSIGYELLVILFLAPPFGFLGITLLDAIVVSAPLSRTGALVLLAGLAVIGSALLHDFQPSLLAAFAFFVLAQFLLPFLYFTVGAIVLAGPTLSPWEEVGLQVLAISVAALVAFSNIGRGNETLARIARKLLRLPPDDPATAQSTPHSDEDEKQGR